MECEKKQTWQKKQKQKQNKTKNKNGMKSLNCFDKIEMLKTIIGCRIKSFLPIENMNVEKLRDT